MDDLIERDALEQFYESGTDPNDTYADMTFIRAEHIEDAPAVNRWIPCSERLPELKKDHESDCVLCYCDTGAYAFSTLQENFFGQVGFACEKEDDYYHSIGKVIAWMPLPEPPKEDENG